MLGVCSLWLAARARAEPWRVVVRVVDASEQALYERVVGQTSDLDVAVHARATEALESSVAAQLARARELGETQDAAVVVWFAHAETALEVWVLDRGAARVLQRSLARGEGELAQSAQEEAAALVVRSAVRASKVGAALGTPERELVPEPAPVLAPKASTSEAKPPPAPPPAPRFRLGGSLTGTWDGASDHGNLALGLRFGLALPSLELGVRGAFGLAANVEARLSELALSAHRAGLYAAYAPALSARVQLLAELGAGLAVYTTEVSFEQPSFAGADRRALLPVLSAALGARAWFDRVFGVAFAIGADVLPERLTLGYDSASGFVRVARAWPVQPTLSLELLARF